MKGDDRQSASKQKSSLIARFGNVTDAPGRGVREVLV